MCHTSGTASFTTYRRRTGVELMEQSRRFNQVFATIHGHRKRSWSDEDGRRSTVIPDRKVIYFYVEPKTASAVATPDANTIKVALQLKSKLFRWRCPDTEWSRYTHRWWRTIQFHATRIGNIEAEVVVRGYIINRRASELNVPSRFHYQIDNDDDGASKLNYVLIQGVTSSHR